MFGRSFLNGKSALSQISWFIGITLVVLLFSTLLSVLIAIPFFGMDVIQDMQNMSAGNITDHMALAKYLQITNHIGMMVIPAIIFAWFAGKSVSSYMYLDHSPAPRTFFSIILISFVSIPFLSGIVEWNMNLTLPESMKGIEEWMRLKEDEAKFLTDAILSEKSLEALLMNMFMIAVVPAFSEEFVFRGVLYRILNKGFRNPHVAIIFASILFSAIHMQFYGFFPRFLLGMMFGYMVYFTGSIWPAMLAHFLNNGSAVIAGFVTDSTEIEQELEGIGATSFLGMVLSLGLTLYLFYSIYKTEKKRAL
ncbi:MAG: CPBP family intramembrane metalloprotease [Bacteroidales bacterium]|nr:CPBP family intramembrane metalloprotease [Bacteroidales bacterium]